MTVEEKVQTVLLAASGLVALVPGERIKPPGDWQSLARPYIVHQPVAVNTIHTSTGPAAAMRQWDFYEIAIYGATYSEARAIAAEVEAALDGYSDSDVDRITVEKPSVPSVYDTDRKVARVTLDFEISGALT